MEKYRVKPSQKINLATFDAQDTSGYEGDKEQANQDILKFNEELEVLQELLYAEHKHKVLIVLQGMDTSGKDGTVRHVFEGVNPQGVKVVSFKVPTPLELDHDYLWRVHPHTPGCGEIVIFNRSHYEDVLVVRVHELVPENVWKKRYDQINAFEKTLVEEGTTILKFFLHISPEEQKARLQERLDDPKKRWKFSSADVQERKRWGEYMLAYEDMLAKTSTDYAPWTIVPANHKWFRNLLIASVVVKTLKALKMEYPQPEENLAGITIP